jgi:N-acetylglucosaminyl-diphospho-decaprenol L-rhamnosyltransferase
MALVSVIIVNYNAGQYLKSCINALLLQDCGDFEIIVVDNASTDNSLASLPLHSQLRILPLDANYGFAKANNIGISHATGEWIATLNPDAFPAVNWLSSLLNATMRYPEYTMFGSTQINAENRQLLDGTGDLYHVLGIPLRGNYGKKLEYLPAEGEVFSPCAAAALYRKDVLLAAGGFDEAFFCYCEDIDLAFRLRLLGERAMQVREAVVYHIGSAITGTGSSFATYHGMRNRVWVLVKNMPPLLLWGILPLFILLQPLFLVRAARKKQFRAALKGLVDALRMIRPVLTARREIQRKRKVSYGELLKAFSWSLG